jgi:hypothetical protein
MAAHRFYRRSHPPGRDAARTSAQPGDLDAFSAMIIEEIAEGRHTSAAPRNITLSAATADGP